MASNPTPEQLKQALSRVIEPDLRKDLVSLNMIKDLQLNAGKICFTIELTTPACPLKEQIENDCRRELAKDFGNMPVEISFSARVWGQQGQRDLLPEVKNIVLVASGKGGVGKSTVASNLAIALAQQGAAVGLMDADIHGPSLPLLFGLQGSRPEMQGDLLLPVEKHGIKTMSIGFLVEANQAIVWRGPMVSNALRQFFTDVQWGKLDYLFIDLPPGTGDIHLTLAQLLKVAGAVIVTTPQQLALADARKAAAMFRMQGINIPIMGVIENMAWFTPLAHPDERYYILGRDGGQTLADEYQVPLLGQIPLVQGIAEAADNGRPIVLDAGNPAATYYARLAGALARQLAIDNHRMAAV
jgi:ATP-binding protein involved in chromosome partitioning